MSGSLPRPVPEERVHTPAIPIAGSAGAHGTYSFFGSSPGGRLAADPDVISSSVPRSSFVPGSSFVAGHSVFSRQTSHAPSREPQHQVAHSRSMGRHSLEAHPSLGRQASVGLQLGLEPGLGLTSPLLGHEAGGATTPTHAAATPTSTVAAEAGSLHGGPTGTYSDGSEGMGSPGAAAAEAAAAAGMKAGDGKNTALRTDVIYGIINAVVGIPTMISFAAIVYQDAIFKPLLGQLARIAFFSAAVHQLVFALFSSLPFAVGQPQDVGLIFLSSMATSVADIGREEGLSPAEIVGTALLTLTVATFLVGVLTMLVAKFKLATLVQYVPLPVVGGYLSYVGYFCIAAGIGLGCSTNISSFDTWGRLLTQDAMIKFVPTITAALVLWVCMTRARSPWALPITLVAVPAAFHLYLLISGTTLAQAQDAGWVLKPQGKSTQQFYELYELFNIEDWHLDGVHLPALFRQLPKMLGLFFVVTFGSCLDVAAIQADTPFPIDFNNELGMVGLSNVIVGLSGSGYTGSYIFSQTIFSMRAGVSGLAHGLIIAALEATIFFLPFSVVQYLPNLFFGALLTVFGIEISGDWLFRSYTKVTRAEYVLLLATFLAIMQFELEMGVAIGFLLCIIYFTITYAKANMAAFNVIPSRSAAVRSYLESHMLDALAGRQATVSLSGFIFFGSSVLLSDKVVALAEGMIKSISIAARNRENSIIVGKDHARSAVSAAVLAAEAAAANGGSTAATPAAAGVGGDEEEDSLYSHLRLASLAVTGAAAGGSTDSLGLNQTRLALVEKQAPAFVILDFRRVLGVDATAAQTLGSLVMVLRRMGVELIISRVRKQSIRRLLVAHGIISASDEGGSAAVPEVAGGAAGDEEQQLLAHEAAEGELGFCRVFETLNEAAKYAEDRLLAMAQAAGLLREALTGLSLGQFFAMHCGQALLTSQVVDVDQITREVAKYGVERRLTPGQRLFSFGEAPESFFLILKGVLVIQVKSLAAPTDFRPQPAQLDVFEIERSFSSGQGAVVGITDFVLRRLRSFQADCCTTSEAVLWEINRTALELMVAEVPEVATALQSVLLRDACLSEVYAYEVLERASMV